MKIAVTAANGKLGSAIISELKKQVGKENIIAIVRTPEKATFLDVELRKGDYNSFEEFEIALKGVDKVLLVSGMDKPENRIQQHRNVIDAAKINNVKKIVYTSIIGAEENNSFSPVVISNRKTEDDIKKSGLKWSIGRNGIYIEPDLEYLENYLKLGAIINCAADGKCGYTSRSELAYAYTKMLIEDTHNSKTYNLMGEAISQKELAQHINEVYNTKLEYKSISVKEYQKDRVDELGEFLGPIITGIYKGIKDGAYNVNSDYNIAAGRPFKTTLEIIKEFKNK